jgi:hypothetical protein
MAKRVNPLTFRVLASGSKTKYIPLLVSLQENSPESVDYFLKLLEVDHRNDGEQNWTTYNFARGDKHFFKQMTSKEGQTAISELLGNYIFFTFFTFFQLLKTYSSFDPRASVHLWTLFGSKV